MKLKVLYFLLPLVVGATILTFCAKEPQINAQENTQNIANQSVTDRGRTNCKVTVTVNYGDVTVCGTNTNNTQCGTGSCNNSPLYGFVTLSQGQTAEYTTNSSIIITAVNGPTLSNVTVTTIAGSITTGVGVGDGDKEFCVDDNCGLTMIR